MVRDRIIAPEDIFFVALYKAVIKKFTLSDLILITGFFTLLISLRYSVNEFSKISKSVNSVLSYALAVALIFSGWITFDKYWSISDRTYGVILSSAVDVRSAPIMRGQNVVFRIHEGTKVEIQHSELGWNEIILLDGKKGMGFVRKSQGFMKNLTFIFLFNIVLSQNKNNFNPSLLNDPEPLWPEIVNPLTSYETINELNVISDTLAAEIEGFRVQVFATLNRKKSR